MTEAAGAAVGLGEAVFWEADAATEVASQLRLAAGGGAAGVKFAFAARSGAVVVAVAADAAVRVGHAQSFAITAGGGGALVAVVAGRCGRQRGVAPAGFDVADALEALAGVLGGRVGRGRRDAARRDAAVGRAGVFVVARQVVEACISGDTGQERDALHREVRDSAEAVTGADAVAQALGDCHGLVAVQDTQARWAVDVEEEPGVVFDLALVAVVALGKGEPCRHGLLPLVGAGGWLAIEGAAGGGEGEDREGQRREDGREPGDRVPHGKNSVVAVWEIPFITPRPPIGRGKWETGKRLVLNCNEQSSFCLNTNKVCAYKKRMSIPETTMHIIFCQL